MNEAPCGDDADDAGSQRHFVIDEDDIGTPAFGKDATISEAGGPGRVADIRSQALASGSMPSAARRYAANNCAG